PGEIFAVDADLADAVRRRIFDLEPVAIDRPEDPLLAEVIRALTEPAPASVGAWEATDRRLIDALARSREIGASGQVTQIVAAALAGDFQSAEAIARRNPRDLHSVLWNRGAFDRWEQVPTDPEWAGDAVVVSELNKARQSLTARFLSTQPRRGGTN